MKNKMTSLLPRLLALLAATALIWACADMEEWNDELGVSMLAAITGYETTSPSSARNTGYMYFEDHGNKDIAQTGGASSSTYYAPGNGGNPPWFGNGS